MRTSPAPVSAQTSASSGSRSPLTSLTITAPAATAARATAGLYVSTDTRAPSSRGDPFDERHHALDLLPRRHGGRLVTPDSPPMSMMSAPASSRSAARRTRVSSVRVEPSSLKESGVALTMPMSHGRVPSCRTSSRARRRRTGAGSFSTGEPSNPAGTAASVSSRRGRGSSRPAAAARVGLRLRCGLGVRRQGRAALALLAGARPARALDARAVRAAGLLVARLLRRRRLRLAARGLLEVAHHRGRPVGRGRDLRLGVGGAVARRRLRVFFFGLRGRARRLDSAFAPPTAVDTVGGRRRPAVTTAAVPAGRRRRTSWLPRTSSRITPAPECAESVAPEVWADQSAPTLSAAFAIAASRSQIAGTIGSHAR